MSPGGQCGFLGCLLVCLAFPFLGQALDDSDMGVSMGRMSRRGATRLLTLGFLPG